jgi:lysozyme
MAKKANAGDMQGACDSLMSWNKAGGKVVNGLTIRRQKERELCLKK